LGKAARATRAVSEEISPIGFGWRHMDQSFLLEHGSGIRRQYQTYVKVAGAWCYLYRAIDRDGNLVDVYLSETRDQEAAEALFRSAVAVTGTTPDKVTTDKHASYPPALDEVFCDDLEHRTSKYLNNHLEIDQTWCLFKSKCFREREDTDELRFGMCFGELSIDRFQRDRQRSARSAYQHSCRAFL